MEPTQQNSKPEDASSVPQMRTFSTDLAEELRKHQGSAMKIAVMENERRFREQENLLSDPNKNTSFVIKGVIIVIFAIAVVSSLYVYKMEHQTVPIVQTGSSAPSIVHSEDLSTLNVTNKSADEIAQAVVDTVKNSTTQAGMIDNIYITQGPVGSETRLTSSMFLSAIGSHVSPDFSHTLVQDYMVGVYSYSGQNLFLVLRGTQHDTMLAGMLQWEPYFLSDLAPLFNIDTTGPNEYLLNNPVTEILIENHDTRAVLDQNKKPVLFYSFLDENTVIIAADSRTLTEAVRRMANE